jgi:hypothetical protein
MVSSLIEKNSTLDVKIGKIQETVRSSLDSIEKKVHKRFITRAEKKAARSTDSKSFSAEDSWQLSEKFIQDNANEVEAVIERAIQSCTAAALDSVMDSSVKSISKAIRTVIASSNPTINRVAENLQRHHKSGAGHGGAEENGGSRKNSKTSGVWASFASSFADKVQADEVDESDVTTPPSAGGWVRQRPDQEVFGALNTSFLATFLPEVVGGDSHADRMERMGYPEILSLGESTDEAKKAGAHIYGNQGPASCGQTDKLAAISESQHKENAVGCIETDGMSFDADDSNVVTPRTQYGSISGKAASPRRSYSPKLPHGEPSSKHKIDKIGQEHEKLPACPEESVGSVLPR